jgi:hypothetical protein
MIHPPQFNFIFSKCGITVATNQGKICDGARAIQISFFRTTYLRERESISTAFARHFFCRDDDS